jgi:hypothetical protein
MSLLDQVIAAFEAFSGQDNELRQEAETFCREFHSSDPDNFTRILVDASVRRPSISFHMLIYLSRYVTCRHRSDTPIINDETLAVLRGRVLDLFASSDPASHIHSYLLEQFRQFAASFSPPIPPWPSLYDHFTSLLETDRISDGFVFFESVLSVGSLTPYFQVVAPHAARLWDPDPVIRASYLNIWISFVPHNAGILRSFPWWDILDGLPDAQFQLSFAKLTTLIRFRECGFSREEFEKMLLLLIGRVCDEARTDASRRAYLVCLAYITQSSPLCLDIMASKLDLFAALLEVCLRDPNRFPDFYDQALDLIEHACPPELCRQGAAHENPYVASAFLRNFICAENIEQAFALAASDDRILRANGLFIISEYLDTQLAIPVDFHSQIGAGLLNLFGETSDLAVLAVFEQWTESADPESLKEAWSRVSELFQALPGPVTLRCIAKYCRQFPGETGALAEGLFGFVLDNPEVFGDCLPALPWIARAAGDELTKNFISRVFPLAASDVQILAAEQFHQLLQNSPSAAVELQEPLFEILCGVFGNADKRDPSELVAVLRAFCGYLFVFPEFSDAQIGAIFEACLTALDHKLSRVVEAAVNCFGSLIQKYPDGRDLIAAIVPRLSLDLVAESGSEVLGSIAACLSGLARLRLTPECFGTLIELVAATAVRFYEFLFRLSEGCSGPVFDPPDTAGVEELMAAASALFRAVPSEMSQCAIENFLDDSRFAFDRVPLMLAFCTQMWSKLLCLPDCPIDRSLLLSKVYDVVTNQTALPLAQQIAGSGIADFYAMVEANPEEVSQFVAHLVTLPDPVLLLSSVLKLLRQYNVALPVFGDALRFVFECWNGVAHVRGDSDPALQEMFRLAGVCADKAEIAEWTGPLLEVVVKAIEDGLLGEELKERFVKGFQRVAQIPEFLIPLWSSLGLTATV